MPKQFTLDFQQHFREIARQNSPVPRPFFVHLTSVIVRPISCSRSASLHPPPCPLKLLRYQGIIDALIALLVFAFRLLTFPSSSFFTLSLSVSSSRAEYLEGVLIAAL